MELFYDDSKKIGIGLIIIGAVFYSLGIMFILERGLLALGNISFLMGIVVMIGPKHTAQFFLRKGKKTGSGFFFGGFLLILLGWFMFTSLGFLCQLFGTWLLFKDFVRQFFSYAQTLPIIGPMLRNNPFIEKAVDIMAGNSKSKTKSSKF